MGTAMRAGKMKPGKASDRCLICGKASSGELCDIHAEARKRLEKHFEVWRARMGIGWEEYLDKVHSNPNTGSAIRDAAAYALKAGAERSRSP